MSFGCPFLTTNLATYHSNNIKCPIKKSDHIRIPPPPNILPYWFLLFKIYERASFHFQPPAPPTRMNCCKILHLLLFEHGMFAAVAEFRLPSVHYYHSLFAHQAITTIYCFKRGFRISPASSTLGFTQEQPQQLQLTHSLWASSNHQSIAVNKAIIKSFSR